YRHWGQIMTKLPGQINVQLAPAKSEANGRVLQRTCQCGQHTIAGTSCSSCLQDNAAGMQRSAIGNDQAAHHGNGVPAIVNEVLRSPGQPLGAETRTFME